MRDIQLIMLGFSLAVAVVGIASILTRKYDK